MDYLCAKFGDFSFSRFGFIVRTDGQNYRQNQRYTHATTVGVSITKVRLLLRAPVHHDPLTVIWGH